MQFYHGILLLLATALPTHADYCYHSDFDLNFQPAITYRYYNSNNGHWSWNAQSGSGVVQDNGWMYFDGDMHSHTAVMFVTFKDGSTTKYQYDPSNENAKGWCQIFPDGAQNNIRNVGGG
ncbi:uncharacterized protein ColSpa_11540 [Colletotrichum spaethianum]|uniref:Uncharacterized protein n=1 Tax=Colletotrichum spaethianum TaxID=700344 RepID=A0AA37UKI8_9PEZI|nr:uncharacterized protein ColSpa_11540 [Colletotrichum spaethianum]GKT51359.1 hypothetical protein ColSpa_11540 [Colletotrichum spaethianum]